MQHENQSKATINVPWKIKLALLVILVLYMLGCSSVPEKKHREIWLIDPEDLVLYRVVNDREEMAIPLSHATAKEFMCISQREFDRVIEDMVKR